jgi:predicted SnoaL-like aldol condensation-catalyzing enzyme
MANDANQMVILRWFDAVNKGDIPLLDKLAYELFTPDFIEHDPRMPDFEPGPAGVKRFIHQVFKENTGVHVTIHDLFCDEDKVAYRFTVSMAEVASGKPVNVQLLAIDRFDGGLIAEEWQLSALGKW